MSRASSRRAGGGWPVLVLALLVAGSIAILERLDRPHPSGRSPSRLPRARRSPARPDEASRPGPPKGGDSAPAGEDADWVPAGGAPPRAALVIDDVGFERAPALRLAGLGIPLTFAILPHQKYSRDLAARLRDAGHEVILHLPMEPDSDRSRPGEGAIEEGMGSAEIASVVRADLDAVPGAVGVNNHMGSRATADPGVMQAVLEVVHERGLYFLDSRTTPGSVGFRMATGMGIPALERGVFLDDRREASYIEAQVGELLRRARQEGAAVAIGHADPVTVEALERALPRLQAGDVELVPASALARPGGGG